VDVIDILREELGSVREPFAALCADLGRLMPDDPAFMSALEDLATLLERLGGAVGVAGFPGVLSASVALNETLLALATTDPQLRQGLAETLAPTPDLILAYVESPGDLDHLVALVTLVASMDVQGVVGDERIAALSEELAAGMVIGEDEEDAPSRPTEATDADVSIALSDDVSPNLLRAYLEEAPGNAQGFTAQIQRYLADPSDHEALTVAKRLAHTLKGSSHIAGLSGIGNVAHQVEDILDILDAEEKAPPAHLGQTLLAAADCMESMIEAVQGLEPPPAQARSVLQGVLDWANKLERGDWSAAETDTLAVPQPRAEPVAAAPMAAAPTMTAQQQEAQANSQLRVSARTMDDVLRLLGEMSLAVGRLQDRLKATHEGAAAMRLQNSLLQQRLGLLEELVTVRGAGLSRRRAAGDPTFDPLEFDEYSELSSVTNALIEAATDARQMGHDVTRDLDQLALASAEQERFTKELQEKVLATRLLPVKEVVPRLQRAVRQTAQMTGKAAQLVVQGDEALIDSEVLNRLMDPLLHLLRNAVDHGIESPDVRWEAGKPEAGTITLGFARQGPNVVMTVSDDGPGLNVAKIRAKAIERGLIDPAHVVSDDEAVRLILLPGFSTRDEVTEVSGRGVGMDVVRERIVALKGTLNIRSAPGQGTHFEARIPASMLSVHALVVAVRGEMFALPTVGVVQALPGGMGQFTRNRDGALEFTHDARTIPAQELAVLVNHVDATPDELAQRPVVIVTTEFGQLALSVDKVLFAREFLARGLGNIVKSVRGVSAVSLMPDGTVIPLLDVSQLSVAPADMRFASIARRAAADESRARVLVVDDSLSVRRTLAELLSDAGYLVTQAADGVEAVEALERERPRVVLTDMEMPRMNGLELTQHLRRRDDMRDLPVIMITSRSTQKHREQATLAGVTRFVTKPYSEASLVREVQELAKA
jgi:chemosensory pili system protein ChpA (sensor histidine kinase/response regulator)